MQTVSVKSLMVASLVGALLLPGCADGPLNELAGLNPYIRRKWSEDEEYAPTFHARVAELKALRSQARRMTGNRQQWLASEMETLVRNDPNPLIRYEALLTLGELPLNGVLPTIQEAASDPDPEMRIAACKSLGKRSEIDAITTLAEVLRSDQNNDVRLASAEELGHFSSPIALGALAAALDETDAALQYRAIQSLQDSTGERYESVVSWKQYLRGEQPDPPPSLVERYFPFF